MSPPPPAAAAAAKVCHVSTSIVRPANQTDYSSQQIQLTPWDLSFLPIQTIQKGLLFIKPKDVDEPNNTDALINHLKTSFSQALNHFYPLAGRLGTTLHEEDNTTSVYINCNSAGAEFIHATVDITLSDFLNPTCIPDIVNSFFSQNGAINYDGQSNPLMSVQVTELIDGIFIGCAVNHSVCDGSSFWHFINSWSEIARASSVELSNQSLRPPVLERWFLKESDSPIRLSSDIINLINQEQFKVKGPVPPLEQRVFHFSPQNLASLKHKANDSQNGHKISSLQALLAHFWVAVTRARCIDINEQTSYMLIMGNRGRLDPPLPEEYFGNSIVARIATANTGELLQNGISLGGLLMNQMIKSCTYEYLRNAWELWMEKPMLAFPSTRKSDMLITGSSPRFNMYGNDFGWGRPIAVRSGCANKGDGKLTVYPGAAEGSMEIEATLSPETLKALGDDAEFMEYVTILPAFESTSL